MGIDYFHVDWESRGSLVRVLILDSEIVSSQAVSNVPEYLSHSLVQP